MNANEVFSQQNGEVTKAFYAELNARGPRGEIAVALFRAQKRSARAKDYSRGRFRRAAYDVKAWSMSELCRLLTEHGDRLGFKWGWKEDPEVRFGEEASWVLYVDIPLYGQVSFHSPSRGDGQSYSGDWDGQHASMARIITFADHVLKAPADEAPALPPAEELETAYQSAFAGNQLTPVAAPRLKFGDPAAIAAAHRRAKSYGPRRQR